MQRGMQLDPHPTRPHLQVERHCGQRGCGSQVLQGLPHGRLCLLRGLHACLGCGLICRRGVERHLKHPGHCRRDARAVASCHGQERCMKQPRPRRIASPDCSSPVHRGAPLTPILSKIVPAMSQAKPYPSRPPGPNAPTTAISALCSGVGGEPLGDQRTGAASSLMVTSHTSFANPGHAKALADTHLDASASSTASSGTHAPSAPERQLAAAYRSASSPAASCPARACASRGRPRDAAAGSSAARRRNPVSRSRATAQATSLGRAATSSSSTEACVATAGGG